MTSSYDYCKNADLDRIDKLEREVAALKAALAWALDNSAYASTVSIGEIQGNGCGCCADTITPPPECAEVIASVIASIHEAKTTPVNQSEGAS